MWAATKKLQRNCLNTLTASLLKNTKVGFHLVDSCPKILASNVFGEISEREYNLFSWKYSIGRFDGVRSMSTARGRSWRSKVEKAMQRDVGKSQQEQRRAKKLKKKLITDEERLIWNLRRSKTPPEVACGTRIPNEDTKESLDYSGEKARTESSTPLIAVVMFYHSNVTHGGETLFIEVWICDAFSRN